MLPDLVGHEVVLGHLLLHLRGLTPVAQGGVLYLFALFRLADHFEGVVHVAFEGGHQVGVLLQLPAPVVHQIEVLVGEPCGQPQFQHLDSRGHLHDQPFLFDGIFRGGHAVFHYHALAGEPLLVSRGAHYLPQGFLHVVVVMFEIPLARHVDRIPVRLVVGHSAAVRTHGHEVVPHLRQEVVEAAAQPPLVGFRVAPLHDAAVLSDRLFVALFVHVGQRRLVDVEQRADLAVMHALILLAFLGKNG